MKIALILWIGLAFSTFGQTAATNVPQRSAEPSLLVRIYRVEINFPDLRRLMNSKEDEAEGQVLRSYLGQNGIKISPPSALLHTEGEKSLVVRSTKENLDKLDQLFRRPASTLTSTELEVIQTMLKQEAGTVDDPERYVLCSTASVEGIRFGDSYEQFSAELRRDAKDRNIAFKEALDDFLQKNQTDTTIVLPESSPKLIELVSRPALEEVFSEKANKTNDGWQLFYERFPGSRGVIAISRVGFDSKGTTAIIYVGKQSHWLSGHGGIHLLERKGGRWIWSPAGIGRMWIS